MKKKEQMTIETAINKKNQKIVNNGKDQKRAAVETQRKLTIEAFSKKGLDIS